jgi:integrase
MIPSIQSPKEGLHMDKHYTDLARKLSKTNRIEPCGKEYVSVIHPVITRLASYLDENGLDPTEDIVYEWLKDNVVPQMSDDQFYDVRLFLKRVAVVLCPDFELKPLFVSQYNFSQYINLPLWGEKMVDEFCFYLLITGRYWIEKTTKSIDFLLFLIANKFGQADMMIDCRITSTYHTSKGKSQRGVIEFIEFLESIEFATQYAGVAYNHYFAPRVNIFDEVSLEDCEDAFTIEEYREASEKLIQARKEAGYSINALRETKTALNEFGIFLELHGRGFSMDAVKTFISVEEQEIKIKPHTRKRVLNEAYDILCGKDFSNLSRIYYPSKSSIPPWAKDSFNAYREMRIKNHMSQSTLAMDYSSILKFCNYLDDLGITSFAEVTPQHVKDFNLHDKHSTAEGKAAYNHRIRGFLRFLYEENVTEHDLSLSVAAVSAVKIKPPVILTEEEETKLNDYLDTTASLLDKALLKIASQTGMRSTDIVNLTFASIDWDNRTFRIVQQKTGVETILPFSNGVGNALYEYITQERPKTESDFIFITPKAPFVPYSRNVLTSALGRALGKRKGAHILRKTLASKMTASSLVFSTVTDALGHTTDVTLDPYISIDERRLKECALPLGEMFAYKGGLM